MTARLTATDLRRSAREAWWLYMLQGVLAVFFGILAIFWPSLTLVTLVYLFSAYILAWGLVEMVRGLLGISSGGSWWLTLLAGLVGLGVGVYLIRHPHVTFATLILLIGITLIARGIIDFLAALLADFATGGQRVLLFLVGVAAVVAGIVILLQPVSGGVAFVWVLGLYALIYGTLTVVTALELHRELDALLED